jgi:hypothetical protein
MFLRAPRFARAQYSPPSYLRPVQSLGLSYFVSLVPASFDRAPIAAWYRSQKPETQ